MSTAAGTPADAPAVSVNALAAPLVDALLADAARLRLGVTRQDGGAALVDAGIDSPGGLEAGCRIAEICLAGLGGVRLVHGDRFSRWRWHLEVTSSQPLLACLASQYAGWSLEARGESKTFRALGSGPARALACKEPLFGELGYRDRAARSVLVLETDRAPPPALAAKVAADCGIAPEALTFILTPTGSLAGVVQIAARVVEVAMHKAHALHFPLDRVLDACGVTPLPPPTGDGLAAMGRTNDTILFGGEVHLFVSGEDEAAEKLAAELPSGASRDYGKPFAEVFEGYEFDFYQVDPMLFSPARVAVTAVHSGRTFFGGRLDEPLVEQSFGGGPPPA